jgi:hypothetical protein
MKDGMVAYIQTQMQIPYIGYWFVPIILSHPDRREEKVCSFVILLQAL